MYGNDYTRASKGLKYIFIGEILAILSLIPLIGGILAIVGLVLQLVGMYTAGEVHRGFKTAFTVTIINLVLSFVSAFVPFMSILTTILGLVEVYLVCQAAADLLREKGDEFQADKGLRVWKMYLVCTVITVVCMVLALIPLLGLIAAVVAVIASIVLLVAGILYIIFLYRAQESLNS